MYGQGYASILRLKACPSDKGIVVDNERASCYTIVQFAPFMSISFTCGSNQHC